MTEAAELHSAMHQNSDESTGKPQATQTAKSQQAHFWRRLIFDSWFCEVFSIIFSTICLVAIAVILFAYDGNASPELPHGLTLNTITSILATASKSSLTFAVAAAMSQLKWCWFQQKSRCLRDLQSFDDASRGPLGSIAMLAQHSGRSLASIGAIIVILTLSFGPFVQQVLSYPVRQVPSQSARATTTQALAFLTNGFDLDFLTAINAGIWSQSGQFDRHPFCPSGNCTWPSFESVGWCTKCEDVTSSASLLGCDLHIDVDTFVDEPQQTRLCNVTFSHGLPSSVPVQVSAQADNGNITEIYITVPAETIWALYLTSNEDLISSESVFLGLVNPILVLGQAKLTFHNVSLNLGYGSDYALDQGIKVSRATECVLTLCAREYNISVSEGVPSAEVVFTRYGITFNENFEGGTTCWKASTEPVNLVKTGNYSGEWVDASNFAFCPVGYLGPGLSQRLSGNIMQTLAYYPGLGVESQNWGLKFSSDTLENMDTIGLSTVLPNIAASLTKWSLDMSNKTVNGSVAVPEVYVRIRWEWFALPTLLTFSGIVFLVITIVISKRRKVRLWKSSALALLYHGLEDDILNDQPVADAISGMEQTARSTVVRLKVSDTKDRVVFGTSRGKTLQEDRRFKRADVESPSTLDPRMQASTPKNTSSIEPQLFDRATALGPMTLLQSQHARTPVRAPVPFRSWTAP
jgi:Protein of unknown function (DUF3176)